MTDYQHIKVALNNAVATITLSAPKSLNALHQAMRLELINAIDWAEQDDAVRVIVLSGEGKAFCAGADLSEGMPGHDSFVDQCAAEYTPWLMGIHNSKKLFIAAVNGVAAGVASAAVMNCDLVIMAEDAYLYQAFSAIGLMPDGGATWLLLHKLGYQRAIEMAVDAGRLSAQQCLELGIANKIVPVDQLAEQAQRWAEQLAKGAPLSQAAVKQTMRRAATMSYADVIDEEARLQSDLLVSEDSMNAVKAFFAKQPPIFKGK